MTAPERRSAIRPEAVSPQKAAKILDVSESTIKRQIYAGTLKAIRVGRQWRILLSELRTGTKNADSGVS